jgi:hypothetical protein
MSAQDKEAASREFNAARVDLEAAQAKFKKAEARFIELTEGTFLARDSKKAPQDFKAGGGGNEETENGYITTDC